MPRALKLYKGFQTLISKEAIKECLAGNNLFRYLFSKYHSMWEMNWRETKMDERQECSCPDKKCRGGVRFWQ